MSNDSMRYNFVLAARCAKCGSPVRFSAGVKVKDWAPPAEYIPEASDGITGMAKVSETLYLHPCDKCYGEATRPLEALREALGALKP